jgi:hypothetical protein
MYLISQTPHASFSAIYLSDNASGIHHKPAPYITTLTVHPIKHPDEEILAFILDRLHTFKRICFDDLVEVIVKKFCVGRINENLWSRLFTTGGAELKEGYLFISQ